MPILLLVLLGGVVAAAALSKSSPATRTLSTNKLDTGWAANSLADSIVKAGKGKALALQYDPGSFVRDTGIQGFSSQEKLVGADFMPDGTPILIKLDDAGLPSLDTPNYVYDLKGRWFHSTGRPYDAKTGIQDYSSNADWFVYVPSHWPGYDYGDTRTFLEKTTDTIGQVITKYVAPVALATLAIFQPEIGIPAALAYTAVTKLATGEKLTKVALDTAMSQYAQNNVPGLHQLKSGVDVVQNNAPLNQILSLRQQIPSATSQRFFDQGVLIGVSKLAQQASIDLLNKKYPAYQSIIKEALDWHAEVSDLAKILGGEPMLLEMEAKINEVRASQSKKVK